MEDNIFKNMEGYSDYVAGKAIKKADKTPEAVKAIRERTELLASKLGYEVVENIVLKDRTSGRTWR